MDVTPGPSRCPEPSSHPGSHRTPKTPVKKSRFTDNPGETTPHSFLATPGSCTSACSDLSSLAATPLSAKMASMADRCIMLLDEYFAEQSSESLRPALSLEAGNEPNVLSADSSSTLSAGHHLAEIFHQYSKLPVEVQDRILKEAFTVPPSCAVDTHPDRSKPPAPAAAAGSKKTREQVICKRKRHVDCFAGLLNSECAGQSEAGE